MTVEIREVNGGKMLDVELSGKLVREDYDLLESMVEDAISRHGTIRVLMDISKFNTITPGGLWGDAKFAVRKVPDLERLAVVGDKKWEEIMTGFVDLITKAHVRYFDESQRRAAYEWVEAEIESAP